MNNHHSRKRSHEEEEGSERRFDFVYSDPTNTNDDDDDVSDLLERLMAIKQRLNEVKTLLSDKDIADWNRHTAYMNPASTIVPYLREKLNIEVGTQAWAKMFEILSNFHLLDQSNLITFHLCEAPGGFISALNHFLVTQKESEKIDWQWFAQTLNPYYEHDPSTASMLIDDDRLIFHTIHENHWDFGVDNSGNLMNEANIEHYIARFQSLGISFITADGSFDVQSNPGEQELLVYPLLKTEVHVALSCLMNHGHFVLKIFTMFERKTIELIFLLYRTFGQISMFKPTTSKNGNSEIYVICYDFNREKFTTSSPSNLYLPSIFLKQLVQCAQFFQSHQINTIEHNLHYFHDLNRRFIKRLHKNKEQTLDGFLNQCHARELLPTDRHLLKAHLPSQRLYQTNQRITRIGTLTNQHQIENDMITKKIQRGFFCLICSKNEQEELCSTCQIFSQISQNPSLVVPRMLIGPLIATERAIIDCVYGKHSTPIRNSCFCNRYLLELCQQIDICQVNEENFDRNSSAIEMSTEELEELQQFTRNYQLNFQSKNGLYYIQSAPILTRLQASVIYILARLFQQTSLYIIPSPSPHLLFVFETFNNNEYPHISFSPTLLQFVHIHQLLDQNFAFYLIQANNLCLQLKYLLDNQQQELLVS